MMIGQPQINHCMINQSSDTTFFSHSAAGKIRAFSAKIQHLAVIKKILELKRQDNMVFKKRFYPTTSLKAMASSS